MLPIEEAFAAAWMDVRVGFAVPASACLHAFARAHGMSCEGGSSSAYYNAHYAVERAGRAKYRKAQASSGDTPLDSNMWKCAVY